MTFVPHEPDVPRLDLGSARSRNPFVITQEEESLEYPVILSERLKREKQEFYKQTLVERTKRLTPRIPMSSHSSRSYRSSRPTTSRPTSTRRFDKENYQKPKSVREKIAEKRDLFKIQLILDKKNQSVVNIEQEMNEKDEMMSNMEDYVIHESINIQHESDRMELELSKARKQSEAAAQIRVDAMKKLKREQETYNLIKSEYSKNQELLETYQHCKEFLSQMCPEGKDPVEYYKDPETLIKQINDLEQANLFIDQNVDHFDDIYSRGSNTVDKQLDDLNSQLAKIDKIISRQQEVELVPEINIDDKPLSEGEIELDDVSSKVIKLYRNCFRKLNTLTPLEMLEKIEARLEELYNKAELVKPEFINSRQSVIDHQRREESRKREIAAREKMLQDKRDHALARATKPIKKKTGRPIYPRFVPQPAEKKSNEQLIREAEEKARLHKLLFEEDDD